MALPRRVFALLAAGGVLAASLVSAAPSNAAVTPARPGDFNGDGYPDLAVGAPGATVNGVSNAGAVAIVYGTAAGLDTTKRQRLQQGVSWVPGSPRSWERFGTDHAAADLNGDGYSDLAVCTPDQDDTGPNVGSMMLTFGSANGLNRGYEVGPAQATREYCTGVAAGDFNADGYADLAVRSGFAYNGPIEIVLGSPEAGFRSKLKRYRITVAAGELSTGDVTGDGFVDLVVGAPMFGNSGGIMLYKGSAGGLVTSPQLVRTPGSFDTAVGDVDGDGFADVVASNTRLGPSGIHDAGLVRLWFGSPGGIDTARGFTLITQDTPGIPDVAEQFDGFGDDLAIGDADGDGYAELAIGSGERIGTNAIHAGTVTVIYGGAGGLDFRRVNHFTEDSPGVPDQVETSDQFGLDLLFRDFSKPADGRADLLVGSQDSGPLYSTEGAVFVLKSTSAGLSGQGSVMFGPRQVGMAPQAADFGRLS